MNTKHIAIWEPKIKPKMKNTDRKKCFSLFSECNSSIKYTCHPKVIAKVCHRLNPLTLCLRRHKMCVTTA